MNPINKPIFALDLDFRELFKGLDAYEEEVRKATNEAAMQIALDGWGRFMSEAPLLTGYLRGSHTAAVNGRQIAGTLIGKAGFAKKNAAVIVWGANAKYAAPRHADPRRGTYGGAGLWFNRTLQARSAIWMSFWHQRLAEIKRG